MSRRHSAKKRNIRADIRYNDIVISKLINNIMLDGKKSLAEKIVYEAFDIVAKKNKSEPLEMFKQAIDNVIPQLEVTSVRFGGSNYQVPSPVNENRGTTLALRWIRDAARKRPENSMVEKLAMELHDAVNKKGAAVKKKDDTHRMAEANKAFAHLAVNRSKRK